MIAGLLLAAGMSSRMGRAKQLLDWQGKALVRHVAEQAVASQLQSLTVVVGYEAHAVQEALHGLPLSVVENAAYAVGQATSLHMGLAALDNADAVVVLLCDQPLITAALIDRVVLRWTQHTQNESAPIALVPRYNGQRGNPVVLSHALFAELSALTGDEGARRVLQRYSARVDWFDLDDPAVVADIDTVEEYERLRSAQEL